ncbi:MAG: paraquat-inducible protein A [Deltaproteobacteria bacterium RIFOXYD12_FULL_50_9]|nr:MAG: paraquat-inducible protein A [Deltaproteobacteria bacterium RIFOXYD12_FULL_50_9]
MTARPLTARRAQMVSCLSCQLLSPVAAGRTHCSRCGSALSPRKVNSLSRCWALVLASYILYLPANLLPVTISTSFGRHPQTDTIMSGVIYFVKTDFWHIALIIFVASICVPLLKLIILTFLLCSLQLGWCKRPLERARLYRLTELVGRWSMVDVYVITIGVGLVKLGALSNFEAGPGAPYFAALVILTMFAVESFDPRLIWDQMEESQ